MEVKEEDLLTDNTEETYADTEGGDSLIDYGEEVGNKEPGGENICALVPIFLPQLHEEGESTGQNACRWLHQKEVV